MKWLNVLVVLVCISAHPMQSAGQGIIDPMGTRDQPNIVILIADDWSWPHASISPHSDPVVHTPNFDKIAQNGVLFTNAHVAAPSCSPSRASILTGRYPHELGPGANLYGSFPKDLQVYPDVLAEAGYRIGYTGKGWGPGNFQISGWQHNPAGPQYADITSFLDAFPEDASFCFWYGSIRPHRPYQEGAGLTAGLDSALVKVPPYLPDLPQVKMDILDYYHAVHQFDQQVGEVLKVLEQKGRLENTLLVVTSDNGWPFPRGKATLYDAGTRVPLAMMWKGKIQKDQVVDDLVNLIDLAPTFLEAAGAKIPSDMSGASLWPALKNRHGIKGSDTIFVERERHSITRAGQKGYPMRAVRTRDFLYIKNFESHRWPAGNPQRMIEEKQYRGADIDRSPTKDVLVENQKTYLKQGRSYFLFDQIFSKRSVEELYDLTHDPHQLNNVINNEKYQEKALVFRTALEQWMEASNDPRLLKESSFDDYKYYGRIPK